MITALGRIDVEQDFQLVVERWEDQNCQNEETNMKKVVQAQNWGVPPVRNGIRGASTRGEWIKTWGAD